MSGHLDSSIRQVETAVIELPLDRPIETPRLQIRSLGCLLVTVQCKNGATGSGFCFTVGDEHLSKLHRHANALVEESVGRSALEHQPSTSTALSHDEVVVGAAFDVAIWDAAARIADLPLHELWGRVRSDVDTYASDGFWLSDPIARLEIDAERYRALGYRAVKVRVGHALDTDLDRLRVVSEALGPGIAIYVDANQSFTTEEAIARAPAYADAGVSWFEEPVDADDIDGHALVRTESSIEIAAGESTYGSTATAAYVDAVDVVMPDLQRVGGYSEFRRVAAAAKTHGVALSSHFFTECTLALAGSEPGMRTVESIGWFDALFTETPDLVDGRLVIPDRPGHGFTFAPDVVERFGV